MHTNRESYFTPLSTRRVIFKMMEELSLCYRYRREEQKAEEIRATDAHHFFRRSRQPGC